MNTLNYKPALIFVVLLVFAFPSCEKTNTDDSPGEPVPVELSSTQKLIVDSDNKFGFDIFRLILENETGKENIMISPLSISYALAMTLNGADGATRDSIMRTLRYYDIDIDDINNSFKDITDKLISVDKRVLMSIANSVWVEEKLAVKADFINTLEQFFAAEVRDFKVSDPGIVEVINQWIEDNTNGLIRNMIDKLPSDVAMLLVNAIYFNGKWRYEFSEESTIDRPFILESGSEEMVPTMSQTVTVKSLIRDDYVIVELPYGQGNYVMDVILPWGENTITDIVSLLNSDSWSEAANDMTKREISIYMPRFKYDYKVELKHVLSAMGMGIAFDPTFADFSNISDQGLAISRVLHQTFIDTSEEGTEAAAATAVEMVFTSVGPSVPFIVRLDKPFLYIIRETTTNSMVFMGKTGNPAI
ncbi:MAG TPA: serpin family protein [Bacteroidales bacterium]|nr:serpin family protein [Bacteroidales bacterium]